jgi:hypothetical protein
MPRRIDDRTVALWRERVERFRSSTSSVEQFCSQEGVSPSSFYNWRKKLEKGAPAASATVAFEPVSVVSSSPGVTIGLPGGARIEIAAGQLDTVRAVVCELARVADHQDEAERC